MLRVHLPMLQNKKVTEENVKVPFPSFLYKPKNITR